MGDISYRPLISGMKWSYSRLKAYEACKYSWFLKYIRGIKDIPCFYTEYGSFIHSILEQYYTGKLKKSELLTTFLINFKEKVRGQRPSDSVVKKYIQAGTSYFRTFEPFPMKTIWVEHKAEFEVDGHDFVGVIDYLGESEEDGLCLVDNKSRDLKPRSGRAVPTAKDKELDDMLRQLYLYCIPVYEEFGRYPDFLCFNCFKAGTFIKEKFQMEKFEEAKQWALAMIQEIEDTEDFEPNQNYFFCKWLCGVSDKCVYDIESREERRR